MMGKKRARLDQFLGQAGGEPGNGRRILLVSAGLLLLVVAAQAGWSRYSAVQRNLEQEIDLLTVQLEKQKRIVEQSQVYRQTNQELKDLRQEIVSTKLIQGDTPALAEAKLQNLITKTAQDYEVNILSMRMLPRERERFFTVVHMGINGRSEIKAIKDFVAHIEHEERFISISKLEIKIVNRREERYFNFSAQIKALASI
ncbi:MAG: type II secretion system protein GspM [Desulfovermiculus sp.]